MITASLHRVYADAVPLAMLPFRELLSPVWNLLVNLQDVFFQVLTSAPQRRFKAHVYVRRHSDE